MPVESKRCSNCWTGIKSVMAMPERRRLLPGSSITRTQKTEKNVSVAAEDMVISAYQPKSTLLKILFEPNSTLEDSATYDITAWSLPYAFGLQTYGLTTRLNPVSTTSPAPAPGASTGQRLCLPDSLAVATGGEDVNGPDETAGAGTGGRKTIRGGREIVSVWHADYYPDGKRTLWRPAGDTGQANRHG